MVSVKIIIPKPDEFTSSGFLLSCFRKLSEYKLNFAPGCLHLTLQSNFFYVKTTIFQKIIFLGRSNHPEITWTQFILLV